MQFLHPGLLWLAPLIALPIIIHLLNRIRYRRVRWAAIDFLLTMERRAVRRARLKQLLLMALRMLLLAAALGALVQPVVRGGLAALLGGSRQVAVLLDASASMSAAGPGGSAFERGRELAARTLDDLSRGARATGGTFTQAYHSPFREPLQDRSAVGAVLKDARLTGGRGDVPRALRAAAESLERGGGGGSIWLLTDLQAGGWRPDEPGEWQLVRQALQQAGKPQIVITDLSPGVESNLSVVGLSVAPAVLVEGDAPKLTATVQLRAKGEARAVANVALFLDGRRVDARTHEFDEPGKADVVFRLPALKGGAHAGYLELSPDALPGDDRHYFVLNAAARLPVLVVEGAPSSVPFDGAGDFVKLALQPPESGLIERSPFTTESLAAAELAGTDISKFAAVVLADVARLAPEALERVRRYVADGGLAIVFPGAHTDAAAWNESKFPGVRFEALIEAEGEKRLKLGAVAPTHPVVAALPTEGLERVLIGKMFRLDAKGLPAADTLIHTEKGEPFLVRTQVGRGKVYVFAVSAQADFSNFPFTPPFLLVLHRIVNTHLVEGSAPLSLPTFAELKLAVPPGAHLMLTPDRRAVPVMRPAEGDVTFAQTELAGIYRLVSGTVAPADPEAAPPTAALNVPDEESELARVDPATIQGLLPDAAVSYLRVDGGAQSIGQGTGARSAASTFPLAVLAILFLVGEVVLAWSMGRPSAAGKSEDQSAVGSKQSAVGSRQSAGSSA